GRRKESGDWAGRGGGGGKCCGLDSKIPTNRQWAALWFDCRFPKKIWTPMRDQITVLLVDDHSLVRRGFRRILEDEADITVVGEAADGPEAIRLAHELHPHVIVMDCAMPRMNGLQATRKILQRDPQPLVLTLI